MKFGILSIIENFLVIYFYVLLVRLALEFANKKIQEHVISKWIFKLTDQVVLFLQKNIPNKMVGEINLNISLIFLLIFYHFLMTLLIALLDVILI